MWNNFMNICRSIIIKSCIEPKLAMIKQLEEGLVLCGVLDQIRSHPVLFKPVFVEDATYVVTSDKLLDSLVVEYSEKQLERKAETTTFKHFSDFVDELGCIGTVGIIVQLQH